MSTATETAGNPADEPKVPFTVTHQAPDIGASAPLTAAYCAERAADAIVRAETADGNSYTQLLACADQWRHLASAMAGNPFLNRPQDERGNDRNRR